MNTHTRTEAARRPRRRIPLAAATVAALAFGGAPMAARAAIEDSYSPGEPPVATTWFGPASPEARRADLDYIAGMRPHHLGALSMSREYLADPGRSSPLLGALARAIIANQGFEIGVLDEVARNLDRPPVRLGPFGAALQPQATEGLADVQRFFKEPVPSEPGHAVGPVSERDVGFAKAMIVHHEAALEMARAYHANRDARNGYLGLLNVDIVTDQTQEIALMRRAIAAYPGNPDAVRVDPSMVHGMEGMGHGGHGAHGAAAPAPDPAARSGGERHAQGAGPAPRGGGGGRGAHPAGHAPDGEGHRRAHGAGHAHHRHAHGSGDGRHPTGHVDHHHQHAHEGTGHRGQGHDAHHGAEGARGRADANPRPGPAQRSHRAAPASGHGDGGHHHH